MCNCTITRPVFCAAKVLELPIISVSSSPAVETHQVKELHLVVILLVCCIPRRFFMLLFIAFKLPWDCGRSCTSHFTLLKLASSAAQWDRAVELAVRLFTPGHDSILTTVSHFHSLLRSWAERWPFWRPPATPSAPAPAHTWTQTACLVCATWCRSATGSLSLLCHSSPKQSSCGSRSQWRQHQAPKHPELKKEQRFVHTINQNLITGNRIF